MNSGTLSPNPWDLSLWSQNVWPYTGGTRTEDRAPQGCDPSAVSSAGMAREGFDAEALPKIKTDPSHISLLRAKNGLDNGVHFRWRRTDLTGPGVRKGDSGLPWRGYNPTEVGRHWQPPSYFYDKYMAIKGEELAPYGLIERLEKMDAAGLIPLAQERAGSADGEKITGGRSWHTPARCVDGR